MKKITILYLDDFKYLGGAEVVLLSLLRHLDKEQFKPILAAPEGDKLEEEAKKAGITFISLPFDELKKSYIRIVPVLKFAQKIRKIVIQNNVDIVHANSLWTLNFAVAALYLKKIPIICSVHAYPRIHSPLKGFLFRLLDGFVSNRTAEFYVVSESLKKEMIEYGFPCGKLIKIENGVDTERFNLNADGSKVRLNENIPENAFVVGIVGRLHPGKGQGVFVDAAKKVYSKHPDIHYLIVGEEYITPLENLGFKKTLEKKIEEYGLSSNFHYMGVQSKIEDVYAAMDIITLPSKEETFGLSILEGMAEGKTVIASNTGGLAELVEHERKGLLIPTENPDALSDAIIFLIENQDVRLKMGLRAAEFASRRYPFNKFIESTILGYKLLVSGFE